jgi:hypothetical protein
MHENRHRKAAHPVASLRPQPKAIEIWKSKELVHNHQAKDRPIGLPVPCELTHCSKHPLRLALLVQLSHLSLALARPGTHIHLAKS